MRAYVKVNIAVQLDAEAEVLAQHHAGVVGVADLAEGRRVVEMLNNHVVQMFKDMSVTPVSGDHRPDLALAHGGCPEPKEGA